MENALSLLYDPLILAHNRSPVNFEKRLTAQHTIEAYNPLCGDKFKLFLDIENGIVEKASFHGYGCAISKAATSVLIQRIEGQRLDGVSAVIKTYFEALDTEGGHFDADLQAFSAVRQFPERLTCATLSWEAARIFFKDKN